MPAPKRTNFRTWDQVMTNELTDPFTEYSDILSDIDATSEEATERMWELFEEAITNYTTETIVNIFHLNLVANLKKYADLVDFYKMKYEPFADKNMHDYYHHERSPDLKSTSTSTGSGSAENTRRQTRTTTSTPGITTTVTHSVNPFDNSGLRSESQDITGETGTGSVQESYSGSPDLTETTSEAESTVTTSGVDMNVYTKDTKGRTGIRPASETLKDGFIAAALHDILDVIINDIADEIFLQVWI